MTQTQNKMIKGSHNTMTYLKPAKWWMWLGRFIAKCQKLDYKQQYKAGARWFDLRISIPRTKNGYHQPPVFSHGIMDYKGVKPEEVLQFLNDKPDAYCRIILEKGEEYEETLFKFYVRQYLTNYPNLKVTQIAKKGVWDNIMTPTAKPPCTAIDAYASANGYYPQYEKLPGLLRSKTWSGWLIDDLYPWLYARFHNKKNLEKYKDSDIILLLDFIGCF